MGYHPDVETKTVAATVATLFRAWTDARCRAHWLPDAVDVAICCATENKSLRVLWADGTTTIVVQFYPTGVGQEPDHDRAPQNEKSGITEALKRKLILNGFDSLFFQEFC